MSGVGGGREKGIRIVKLILIDLALMHERLYVIRLLSFWTGSRYKTKLVSGKWILVGCGDDPATWANQTGLGNCFVKGLKAQESFRDIHLVCARSLSTETPYGYSYKSAPDTSSGMSSLTTGQSLRMT